MAKFSSSKYTTPDWRKFWKRFIWISTLYMWDPPFSDPDYLSSNVVYVQPWLAEGQIEQTCHNLLLKVIQMTGIFMAGVLVLFHIFSGSNHVNILVHWKMDQPVWNAWPGWQGLKCWTAAVYYYGCLFWHSHKCYQVYCHHLTCNLTYVIIGLNAPARDYNIHGTKVDKIFSTIGASASLVFAYNTGMLPEIQVGQATRGLFDPSLLTKNSEKKELYNIFFN